MCFWNLNKLAEAIDPMLPYSESGPKLKERFWRAYNTYYETQMARKFGFTNEEPYLMNEDEKSVLTGFFKVLDLSGCDFTNTFRDLSQVNIVSDEELLTKILAH